MVPVKQEDRTRWGIAACGGISNDFTSCLKAMEDEHEVVACASNSGLENALEFAKTFEIGSAYGSYEDLANDERIEIVYIGSLNPTHITVAKLMLNSGKHILVEKPMGMNQSEVRSVFNLAREKQLFAMEGMWTRFLPVYQKLASELQQQSIGQPKQITTTFGVKIQNKARIQNKDMGGGVSLDLGVYCLHSAFSVFGFSDLQKIIAGGHLNDDGVDDSVSVTLLYKNGKTASLIYTDMVELPNELVIAGTDGTITIPGPFWCAETIVTRNETHNYPMPDTYAPCRYLNSGGLRFEANEARRCLQLGLLESPKLTHEETVAMHGVLDEIRRQVGVVYPADAEPPVGVVKATMQLFNNPNSAAVNGSKQQYRTNQYYS